MNSLNTRASLVAAAFALALACGKEGDPVRECLDDLTRAAHQRDAKALFEHVTAGFQAEDESSRSDCQALARRYFAAYEMLDVTLQDVMIERSDQAARARFRAQLSGRPRKFGGLDSLFPRSSTYDFDVRLVPEGRQWKIAWASWKEAGQ